MSNHEHSRSRGPASRTATAVTLITVLAIGLTAFWLATSDTFSQDEDPHTQAAAPLRENGIGACLHVDRASTADAVPLEDAMRRAATANAHLFPALGVTTVPPELEQDLIVALWPDGTSARRGAGALAVASDVCTATERTWALAVTLDLLADGADRLLESAEFGSDWTAHIEVTLDPGQSGVRSTLHFSGPLGVSGSCWVDENLVIDLQTGLPDVERKSGNDAGLAGIVACRRFESELADGGAGAQALKLLPATVVGPTAGEMLTVTHVEVTDELVIVSGEVAR